MARDGNATQLEPKDLLSVIQDKGDVYKFAIARKLIISKDRTRVNDAPSIGKVSKNIKPTEYDVGEEMSGQN